MQALKLHLELEDDSLTEADWIVLKSYGKVKKSLSRTILVSADMNFHALNYAIQRAFGWQDKGAYHFLFDDELFQEMTKNGFRNWTELCGIYFRFPVPIIPDNYWKETYNGKGAISKWQKKYYVGPYEYLGYDDNYLENQMRKSRFEAGVKALRENPEKVKLDEVKISKDPNYILERLALSDVLVPKGSVIESFEETQKKVMESSRVCSSKLTRNVVLIKALKLHKLFKDTSFSQAAKDNLFEVYQRMTKESNPTTLPITDTVFYSYEKEAPRKWRVRVTCEECLEVEECELPICLERDGLSVFEDVKDLKGYCKFLRDLSRNPSKDYTAKLRMWAKNQGWSERRKSVKYIL